MMETNNKPNRKRGRRKRKNPKVMPMTTKLQDLLQESTVKAVKRIAEKREN